jgi:hypothetical protein
MACICSRSLRSCGGSFAHDVTRHHRRRRLPERARLHVVRKIRHHAVFELQIDGHLRAAQLRVRHSRAIRRIKAALARNVGGKTEDLLVVDIVQHDECAIWRGFSCNASPFLPYGDRYSDRQSDRTYNPCDRTSFALLALWW